MHQKNRKTLSAFALLGAIFVTACSFAPERGNEEAAPSADGGSGGGGDGGSQVSDGGGSSDAGQQVSGPSISCSNVAISDSNWSFTCTITASAGVASVTDSCSSGLTCNTPTQSGSTWTFTGTGTSGTVGINARDSNNNQTTFPVFVGMGAVTGYISVKYGLDTAVASTMPVVHDYNSSKLTTLPSNSVDVVTAAQAAAPVPGTNLIGIKIAVEGHANSFWGCPLNPSEPSKSHLLVWIWNGSSWVAYTGQMAPSSYACSGLGEGDLILVLSDLIAKGLVTPHPAPS